MPDPLAHEPLLGPVMHLVKILRHPLVPRGAMAAFGETFHEGGGHAPRVANDGHFRGAGFDGWFAGEL